MKYKYKVRINELQYATVTIRKCEFLAASRSYYLAYDWGCNEWYLTKSFISCDVTAIESWSKEMVESFEKQIKDLSPLVKAVIHSNTEKCDMVHTVYNLVGKSKWHVIEVDDE